MEVVRWRHVRWIPRLLARWLGGAAIVVGILYVWLLYILTHPPCPGPFHARALPHRGREMPPPPCGYHTAWFFALLGISAAVALVPVAVWFLINRRLRKR